MAERLRVVVDVMPKPEILDPQGQAIAAALATLGFTGIRDVRAGKRFELAVDTDPTPEVLDRVREAASHLLANPVIEDYTVRVEREQAEGQGPGGLA
jgi:phosphoribosylformylglycinamidine synthase